MATRLAAANRIADNGRMPVAYPPDADGYLPLKTSVVGRWILGAISYTRATPATVTDHEWVIRNCLSGEARFRGARRVNNLFSYSQDYNNAYWTRVRTTVVLNSAIGVDGKMTAAKITGTAVGGSYAYTNITYTAWRVYVISARIKPINVVTPISISLFGNSGCAFDLKGAWTAFAPTGSGEMSDSRITALANGYYRISVKFSPTTSVSLNTGLPTTSYVGDICYIDWVQLEDVTGQSVQTPWEYVSTNVLTGAPYHGACVDGVKYFDTDLNGTPIPASTLKGYFEEWARTNICPYSDFAVAGWWLNFLTRVNNAWIAPDGTNSFVKIIPTVGSNSSYAYNVNITTTAQVYTLSCYMKAAWFNFVQLRFGGAISSGYANFDLLNWVVGTRSIWTNSWVKAVPWFPWVYQIWATTNTVAAATSALAVQVIPAADSLTGAAINWDWVSWVMTWGMQIEGWPSVSSHIPTTTVAVARNMDVLTYDVRNAIANQWAFSAVFSMDDDLVFDRRALNFSGANNNRLQFQARRSSLSYTNVFFWDGAAVRSVTSTQEVWTNNIAVAWTNWVSVDMYMNNTKYSSADIPNIAFSTIDVGGGANSIPIFWCIRDLRIWKTRPTDDELLILSNNP